MTVCGSSTGATRSKGLYKSSAFTGCNTICPWEAFSGMLFCTCTSVKLQALPLHFCVLVTISILGSVFKYGDTDIQSSPMISFCFTAFPALY